MDSKRLFVFLSLLLILSCVLLDQAESFEGRPRRHKGRKSRGKKRGLIRSDMKEELGIASAIWVCDV